MPRLIDRLTEGVRGFIWPALHQQESDDSRALRLMYDSSNAENLVRGCWYGLHAPTGIRTGVMWVCYCGMSYNLLESEKLRVYTCSQCKRPMDFAGWTGLRLSKNKQERTTVLNRLAGIVLESDYLVGAESDWLAPDKQELVLRHVLKVRPAPGKAAGPQVSDPGENGFDGDFSYEKSTPSWT